MSLRAAPETAGLTAVFCASFCAALLSTGCTALLGNFSNNGDASVGEGGADSGGDSLPLEEDGGQDGGCQGASCTDSGEGGSGLLAQGAACTSDSACSTGHCVDTVCCESACSGVCMTCNAPGGTPGTCVPIAANTDPDLECVSIPVPEAGVADSGAPADAGEAGPAPDAGDAATDAASASDAPGGDGASSEAGPPINFPEGGVTTDDTKCAGACNGQGACAYPDKTQTCGTLFCNTTSQEARLACDGTGHCGAVDLQDCVDYACKGTACGTSCSQVSDCLSTAYCNTAGSTPVCVPQLGNGVGCSLDSQCQSGFCVGGVCCESACDVPGGTCTQAGSVGQCKCSVTCGDGGSCQLFYRDADGDGYGNYLSTAQTQVGCSGSPPAGYVADHTDCNDNDANVFPGQTAYFGTASAGTPLSGYDYNCDGVIEKSVPEYPGSFCEFCGGTSPSCTQSDVCATADTYAGFGCSSHFRIGICNPITHICTLGDYCGYDNNSAFTATIACGSYAAETTCGECAAASGTPPTTTSSVQQECH
jgi:hypothetical protein